MGICSTNPVVEGLELVIKEEMWSLETHSSLSLHLPDSCSLLQPARSETMAKDMTVFWGSGSPPCWRVLIALEEKNLQGYNSKMLSFEKGEHKSKEVMEVNPRGQVGSLYSFCQPKKHSK